MLGAWAVSLAFIRVYPCLSVARLLPFHAASFVKSPLTLAVIRWACFIRRRKSHEVCRLNQNCGLCLKNLPSLSDISGVIARRPSTISLMLRGLTPKARPSAFCEPKRSGDRSPRRPNTHGLEIVLEQNLSGRDRRFHLILRKVWPQRIRFKIPRLRKDCGGCSWQAAL